MNSNNIKKLVIAFIISYIIITAHLLTNLVAAYYINNNSNTVWVLLMINKHFQVFVNTFTTEEKCKERISQREPVYDFNCIQTRVNK